MPRRRAVATELLTVDLVEAVRRRPGPYLGDVCAADAVEQLLVLALDGVLELCAAGELTEVRVVLREDGSIVIADDGPGASLAVREGRTELEHAFYTLGLGRIPRGGAWGIVNAVCQSFELDNFRDGRHVRLVGARGVLAGPLLEVGPSDRQGTRMVLSPDPDIFMCVHPCAQSLGRRLDTFAAFAPGLRVELRDERPRTRQLGPSRGLGDLLAVPDDALVLTGEWEGMRIDAALRWDLARSFRRRVRVFVNTWPSAEPREVGEAMAASVAECVAPRLPKYLVRSSSVVDSILPGLDLIVRASWAGWSPSCDVSTAVGRIAGRALPVALLARPELSRALRKRALDAARSSVRTPHGP